MTQLYQYKKELIGESSSPVPVAEGGGKMIVLVPRLALEGCGKFSPVFIETLQKIVSFKTISPDKESKKNS